MNFPLTVDYRAALRQDACFVATVARSGPLRLISAVRRLLISARSGIAALVTAGLTLSVLGFGVAGCTNDPPAAAGGGEIRVGLVTSLSGADANGGRDAERGAQLAAYVVNTDQLGLTLPLGPGQGLPRMGGARLTVVSADTGGSPERAVTQAVRLVESEGVDALITADSAGATAAVVQRTERLRVPSLDGRSSAGFLTNLGLDFYFRTSPADRDLGASALSLVRSKGDAAGRVAIIAASDETASTLVPALRDLAAEAGFQLVTTAEFAPGSVDPANAARQVRTAAPDTVLVVAGAPADAVEAVRAVQSRGPALPIIGLGSGFLGTDFATGVGASGAGVFRVTPWSSDLAPRQSVTKAVADLYQQRFNSPMSEVAAGSFTATLTLAAGFDEAAATEADKVRVALLGIRLPGSRTIMPWDGVQFRENGQNTLASAAVEQLTGGAFKVVFPRELASAPVAWPSNAGIG
jgi:branched-chain amino acid transport system substrate-binding protein